MELVLLNQAPTEELDFEAIVADIDLLEVAQSYTELRQKGKHWTGLCPLHAERTGSFTVTPEEKRWFCYGCHKGGDVINLVALIEGVRNGEAARRLATEYHVKTITRFERVARKTTRQMEGWRERKENPPPIEQGQIPPSIPLESYRGFSAEAIGHFGLRLIPGAEWGSGIYIPIKDQEGTLIGYSIRQPDGLMPKYLNSQGLKKQGIMFGLAENKVAIAGSCALLVEGQFDCVRMWDLGFRNVLSTMGSNLSIQQALLLARLTTRLVLVFDGDNAGREGMKQIKDRYGSAFDILCVYLPEDIDPCTATHEDIYDKLTRN